MKHFFHVLLITMLGLPVSAMQLTAQSRPAPPGSTEPVRLTTPRIPPLPESQWTDRHRALVAQYAPDGRVGNGLATLLHVPELVEAVLPFTTFLSRESSLPSRERELLVLRIAWLAQNQYLWAAHAPSGRRAGLTETELRQVAMGPGADAWNPFDAGLLTLADELFRKLVGQRRDLDHVGCPLQPEPDGRGP